MRTEAHELKTYQALCLHELSRPSLLQLISKEEASLIICHLEQHVN